MLLTIEDAAKELKCSPETLWRQIRLGRLPAYKLSPRTTRVDMEELKAFGRRKVQAGMNFEK